MLRAACVSGAAASPTARRHSNSQQTNHAHELSVDKAQIETNRWTLFLQERREERGRGGRRGVRIMEQEIGGVRSRVMKQVE